MNLESIILQNAAFCNRSNICVEINAGMSWVTIKAGQAGDGIFLQGDDAVEFIDEVDSLSDYFPDLNIGDIEMHVAHKYLDLFEGM